MSGTSEDGVAVRAEGPVGVVTIDRQHRRNALDPAALLRLAAAVRNAGADGLRALVLTGAGEIGFSSGMDLTALASLPRAEVAAAVAAFNDAMRAPDRVPVVAAVNGAAVGGGFEIALRCDLVVAAPHATFGLPEVTRGLVPGGGGTLLPARVPLAVALEIGLLGEPISAERALALGLVNRVVPANELLPEAVGIGRRIAANGPRAVAATRRLMWTTATDGAAAAWAATQDAIADDDLRREMQEGIAAWLEKRADRR